MFTSSPSKEILMERSQVIFVEVTRLKPIGFFNSKQDVFLIGSSLICVKVFPGSGIDKKSKKFVVRLQSCHIKLDREHRTSEQPSANCVVVKTFYSPARFMIASISGSAALLGGLISRNSSW